LIIIGNTGVGTDEDEPLANLVTIFTNAYTGISTAAFSETTIISL
jgi:hypothetical protein